MERQVLLNELRRTKGSSPHPLLDNLLEDVPAKLSNAHSNLVPPQNQPLDDS